MLLFDFAGTGADWGAAVFCFLAFVLPREPWTIWKRDRGGAAMYGGLLVVLPASIPILAALKIPAGLIRTSQFLPC